MDRLLVIEDEAPVRAGLRMLFEDEGFVVEDLATGEEGLAAFRERAPDVVLLDLRLPGMRGFEVLRALRRESDVPVVIVSAQVDSHDIVAGLEAGADDYVTKPFVSKELIARVRASMRRAHVPLRETDTNFAFGDLDIRPSEGIVRERGMTVPLTKTEFGMLCEFARHAGQVLSRDQLLEAVWGFDYLGDSRLVDAHIRRLRTKIEPDPAQPRYVVTVRGLGYRLERGSSNQETPKRQ